MTQVNITQISGNPSPALTVLPQINDMIAAVRDGNSGSGAPSPTVAHMVWVDTSTSPPTIKRRNAANSAWVAEHAAIGGGMALITRSAFTSVSVADFTLPNASEFRNVMFTWRITGFSNTNNTLGARVSTTAGSFNSSPSTYNSAYFAVNTAAASGVGANGALDFMPLSNGIGSAVNGRGWINGFGVNGYKPMSFESSISNAAEVHERGMVRFYGNTSPLLAMRFFPASAATMTGEIIMYGERL